MDHYAPHVEVFLTNNLVHNEIMCEDGFYFPSLISRKVLYSKGPFKDMMHFSKKFVPPWNGLEGLFLKMNLSFKFWYKT